ncbi:uroporphyrinogen-III synthase [Phreatobacter stygius]|uniref:Uroporphyrinogen-III synthase n=1 Tax=Phreatobacter stygius TaxID=1940610 RepID=A0A4D7BA08_9HYPH|nr:uroporphyrinogen-III synthase [Phreatobacter stygius]QCI64917.1 uroporphyrinogen-III synthase [Phreatobacter stygius]
MRVLVTRPEPEASRTAVQLAALGHQPVVAPLLVTEPLAADLPTGAITALAVTSPRTASLIDRETVARLAAVPVFSVGDRTAAAMVEAGFRDVRSAAGDVAALGRLLAAAGLARGAHVLSIGGEERAGDLAALVAPAGLIVSACILYRMVPVAQLPPALADALGAAGPAAALHYSPRSAATFVDLVAAAGLEARSGPGPGRLVHLCLSAAVAEPLRQRGYSGIRIATRPDEAALLDLIGG